MTELSVDFVGPVPHSLPRTERVGAAIAVALRAIHPEHTAKKVANDLKKDMRTVENILAGHVSDATLTPLFKKYGRALIEAMATSLTGETHAEFLGRVAYETEQAAARAAKHAQDVAALEALVASRLAN